MSNTTIKVFENKELGKVRVVMIDNEPWWVLADVCKVLELSNPTKVADRLDIDEKANFELGFRGGSTNCINESGLYTVILRSDKPQAKPFRKWVTHDVLPSIRKTGGYVASGKEIDFMNNSDSPIYPYIAALTKSIEILQSQVMMLQTRQQPNYWLWKNHVAAPAVSNLSEKLNVDMRTAYDLIYDQMFNTYGFDRSFAISQFCAKYGVDNVSVIDCIADNPIYQHNFISTISNLDINTSDNNTVAANNSNNTSLFVTDDNFNYVIKTLSGMFHQTITQTTRQVYSAMNTKQGWKNIMTRRHFNSKKAIIENCKDYKKKFIIMCNKMATGNIDVK